MRRLCYTYCTTFRYTCEDTYVLNMIRLRANNYQINRRVPKRYASVEPRSVFTLSLHTDSKSVAEAKAVVAWKHAVEGWEARLAGDAADAARRFDAARELAAVRGYRYLQADKVAQLPLDQLVGRIEAVPTYTGIPDRLEAAAVLGGTKPQGITVSAALDLYWHLAADLTLGKSDDQLRRWKNPRIKAVKNFIAVVGDKTLDTISGDDMLDFRTWWLDRIMAGEVTANAGNKDLTHLGGVLKTVNMMKRLGLVLPLSGLSFKEGESEKRPPFSDKWIKEKLLDPSALVRLNPEARAIVLMMVNTGARPSELAALSAKCIRLDCPVPHISIEAEARQLKSVNARRIIPLLGVSLASAKSFPSGFPAYATSSASLSATVNKFLRSNGLMETEDHTLYGLRHSFEDRLLAAGVDERIRRDLMGHSLDRERYGTGGSLEHLRDVVKKVAF